MKRVILNVTKKIPGTTQAGSVVVYQTKSGALALQRNDHSETVWATQGQIVSLFAVDQSVVSRHIKNIFADGEVDQKSNMQKMHIANSDKPVTLYSLDVMLAVGYRTNSKVAIDFRKWATKTLSQHIFKGYTLDKKRVAKHYGEFMQVVADVKALLPVGHAMQAESVIELVQMFADTWLSLDAYDKETLTPSSLTKKSAAFTASGLTTDITTLKNELIRKGEATTNFAQERNSGSLAGIVGNVLQSLWGTAVYPSVEEKAAHLLYFVIKNHPFVDGNKRSGAYAFVWFFASCSIT